MADDLTVSFVMHGARDAISRGLTHVEQQVKSIEQAVIENPGLAFDLAGTLIESVCRTVLRERNISFDESDDLPQLFRTVSQHLPFLPSNSSGATDVRESLRRILNGLNTTIQGICELRNQCGFASHGSGAPRPQMESAQALLAAEAADTIVGFLYRVHRPVSTPSQSLPTSPQTQYDDHSEFNAWVDETHDMIRIFEIEFPPSKVLFQMEPESYRIYLAEFNDKDEDTGTADSGDSLVEEVQ